MCSATPTHTALLYRCLTQAYCLCCVCYWPPQDLYDLLQSPCFTLQIGYGMLDALLAVLYPELQPMLRALHSATTAPPPPSGTAAAAAAGGRGGSGSR